MCETVSKPIHNFIHKFGLPSAPLSTLKKKLKWKVDTNCPEKECKYTQHLSPETNSWSNSFARKWTERLLMEIRETQNLLSWRDLQGSSRPTPGPEMTKKEKGQSQNEICTSEFLRTQTRHSKDQVLTAFSDELYSLNTFKCKIHAARPASC